MLHVLATLPAAAPFAPDKGGINSGDNGWILASSALVLFMTPGLAFFYGGMVRRKNVLGMLMQNWVVMGIVGVLWVWLTYSLAFGDNMLGGFVGNFHFAGLAHIDTQPVPGYSPAQTIDPITFVVFQMMFAVITPALITGVTADRIKFGAYCVYMTAWSVLVYAPVAHWVFSPEGWLFQKGALDFAGGTVVHINAAMGGMGLLMAMKKSKRNRKGWPNTPMKPHNVPFIVLGAGMLWFGWFGFNAGSALGANNLSAHAFVNTNTATAAAVLGWLIVEKIKIGKPTTLGGASGAIAGLVAITPSCGFVNLLGATVIGVLAGAICALACSIKFKAGFDDALDVFGVHFVGGVIGAILIGFFGTTAFNSVSINGIFYGGSGPNGGVNLLLHQFIAVVCVAGYSLVASFIIAKVIDLTMGLRMSDDDEEVGMDLALHDESGYDFESVLGSMRSSLSEGSPAPNKPSPTEVNS